METKPFNLSAALLGSRLITRGGVAVKGFRLLKSPMKPFLFAALIGNSTILTPFTCEGRVVSEEVEHPMDLFLLDNKNEVRGLQCHDFIVIVKDYSMNVIACEEIEPGVYKLIVNEPQ